MKLSDLIKSSMGNILEWFDFGLFIFFAPIIGPKFFHTHSLDSSILSILSIFAMGFISRPIGGLIFGHIGDKYGRSLALKISILLIATCTFCTGFLPTYETVGIFAPIIFILIRIIQGISVGGEYSGVMIYLTESAEHGKKSRTASLAAIGANLGFMLVSVFILGLKYIFPEEIILAWAWRIPFIFIGILGIIIFINRVNLSETPIYKNLKENSLIAKKPVLHVLRFEQRNLIKIVGLSCMGTAFYYTFFGYMTTYINLNLGMSSNFAFILQTILLIIMILIIPIAGLCGDYFGRKKALLLTSVGMIIFAIPCFLLLNTKNPIWIIFALLIATFISSFEQGNSLATIVEVCPSDVRYTGISIAYNLGNGIFGGAAPVVVNILTNKIGPIGPAYYIILMAGISFIAILSVANNSYDKNVCENKIVYDGLDA